MPYLDAIARVPGAYSAWLPAGPALEVASPCVTAPTGEGPTLRGYDQVTFGTTANGRPHSGQIGVTWPRKSYPQRSQTRKPRL
jgi:hypothetical protein